MRVLIVGIIFSISVNVCSYFPGSHHYKKPYTVTQTDLKLREYFEDNSQDSLKLFFKKWENELQPYSRSNREGFNDTLKTIYDIFSSFYKTDSNYVKFEYTVLQNSIMYSIVSDTVTFNKLEASTRLRFYNIKFDTLKDFRPYPEKQFNKILYLIDKYKSALNYFFNEENGNYNCVQNFDKELLEKKRIFIGSYIKLLTKNRCTIYYSFPYLDKIVFNSDLSKTKIFFRNSGSSGGGKVYSVIDGKWRCIKDLPYWVVTP